MDIDNLRATTIVAAKYRDGVIIAADKQLTDTGNLNKLHITIKKLICLGDCSIAGVAGFPKILNLLGKAKGFLQLWRRKFGSEVSPDGVFNFLSEKVPLIMSLAPNQMASGALLLASFDNEYKCGRIFRITPSVNMEIDNSYTSIGAGEEHAISYLHFKNYQSDASYDEAVSLMAGALHFSHKKNGSVGDEFFAYAIDENGTRDISDYINVRKDEL